MYVYARGMRVACSNLGTSSLVPGIDDYIVGTSAQVAYRTLRISRCETGHFGVTKYQIEQGTRHSRRVSGAAVRVGAIRAVLFRARLGSHQF